MSHVQRCGAAAGDPPSGLLALSALCRRLRQGLAEREHSSANDDASSIDRLGLGGRGQWIFNGGAASAAGGNLKAVAPVCGHVEEGVLHVRPDAEAVASDRGGGLALSAPSSTAPAAHTAARTRGGLQALSSRLSAAGLQNRLHSEAALASPSASVVCAAGVGAGAPTRDNSSPCGTCASSTAATANGNARASLFWANSLGDNAGRGGAHGGYVAPAAVATLAAAATPAGGPGGQEAAAGAVPPSVLGGAAANPKACDLGAADGLLALGQKLGDAMVEKRSRVGQLNAVAAADVGGEGTVVAEPGGGFQRVRLAEYMELAAQHAPVPLRRGRGQRLVPGGLQEVYAHAVRQYLTDASRSTTSSGPLGPIGGADNHLVVQIQDSHSGPEGFLLRCTVCGQEAATSSMPEDFLHHGAAARLLLHRRHPALATLARGKHPPGSCQPWQPQPGARLLLRGYRDCGHRGPQGPMLLPLDVREVG